MTRWRVFSSLGVNRGVISSLGVLGGYSLPKIRKKTKKYKVKVKNEVKVKYFSRSDCEVKNHALVFNTLFKIYSVWVKNEFLI